MSELLLAAFLSMATVTVSAQLPKSINTNDFVLDCMKNGGEIPHREMVLWIPTDFWKIVYLPVCRKTIFPRKPKY
jgi:hypothetical protein